MVFLGGTEPQGEMESKDQPDAKFAHVQKTTACITQL